MKSWPTWISIAIGMVARVIWGVFGPTTVSSDAGYRSLARSLAEGHGYATAAGPSAYWMPGWAAWMAIFYRAGLSDGAIVLMNVALGGATLGATWALAREVLPDAPKVARLAVSLCALTPSLVLLPRLLLSENLALPLFTLATLSLAVARRTRLLRHWALFGLAAAVATYARESCGALVLAGLAFALLGSGRTRTLAAACVVCTFGAAVTPWIVRNHEALGVTTLTTSAGVNLCIGLGEGATGGYRTLAPDPVTLSEVAVYERGLACAREGFLHHPLGVVALAPAKLSRLIAWDDWIVDDFLSSAASLPRAFLWMLRALCDGVYWVLCVGAVVGAWRTWRSPMACVAWVVIATAFASVLVTFGAGRFHAPLLPLLAMLAAHAWCYRRAS